MAVVRLFWLRQLDSFRRARNAVPRMQFSAHLQCVGHSALVPEKVPVLLCAVPCLQEEAASVGGAMLIIP